MRTCVHACVCVCVCVHTCACVHIIHVLNYARCYLLSLYSSSASGGGRGRGVSGGRGQGGGGGFGRGSGGRDRSIIHKTVRVIKGPFKGTYI